MADHLTRLDVLACLEEIDKHLAKGEIESARAGLHWIGRRIVEDEVLDEKQSIALEFGPVSVSH